MVKIFNIEKLSILIIIETSSINPAEEVVLLEPNTMLIGRLILFDCRSES